MNKTEQKVATARGMFEAMRHQRDKAQAGLDAAQAEIRRLRTRAETAEARVARVRDEVSAYRQAGASDLVPVASAGVLLLALIDGDATK